MLATVLADMRSHIDIRQRRSVYWAKVFGKALVTPAIHVVILYRVSHALYQIPVLRPFSFLLRAFSIVWSGTEIHPAARIGPGLCLVHSQKVLIGEGVTIGRNCRISHGVSIGGDAGRHGNEDLAGWPVIGDDVTIALDSIVLGPLTVGAGAVVSAQAMVVRDVAPYTVVAGSPARVVRKLDQSDPVPEMRDRGGR